MPKKVDSASSPLRPWYWPEGGQPHRTEPFTWITQQRMAASWWPDPPVIDVYRKEGIKVIVNCSEFDNRIDIPREFAYYHIHVEDYGLPRIDQIEAFLNIARKHETQKEPVVIHCVAGCGRTGQFIVAWGANNGMIPKNTDPVEWIRNRRRCALETEEQMTYARKLAAQFSQPAR